MKIMKFEKDTWYCVYLLCSGIDYDKYREWEELQGIYKGEDIEKLYPVNNRKLMDRYLILSVENNDARAEKEGKGYSLKEIIEYVEKELKRIS